MYGEPLDSDIGLSASPYEAVSADEANKVAMALEATLARNFMLPFDIHVSPQRRPGNLDWPPEQTGHYGVLIRREADTFKEAVALRDQIDRALWNLTLGNFRIAVASAGANSWPDDKGNHHYSIEVWATATRMREAGE